MEAEIQNYRKDPEFQSLFEKRRFKYQRKEKFEQDLRFYLGKNWKTIAKTITERREIQVRICQPLKLTLVIHVKWDYVGKRFFFFFTLLGISGALVLPFKKQQSFLKLKCFTKFMLHVVRFRKTIIPGKKLDDFLQSWRKLQRSKLNSLLFGLYQTFCLYPETIYR